MKNTQLAKIAQNIATSEINAQLDDLENDTADPVIQAVWNNDIDNTYDVETSTIANVGLKANVDGFEQDLTMTLRNDVEGNPPEGFSIQAEVSLVKTLSIDIQSTAEITNTSATSTQTQGIYYIVPNAN